MVDSEIKSLIFRLPRLNDHIVSLDDGCVSDTDEHLKMSISIWDYISYGSLLSDISAVSALYQKTDLQRVCLSCKYGTSPSYASGCSFKLLAENIFHFGRSLRNGLKVYTPVDVPVKSVDPTPSWEEVE